MTPAELAAAGQRLYGNRWQTALANWLGVAPRSVRRWVAGQDVPEALARRIAERLEQLDAPPAIVIPGEAFRGLSLAEARAALDDPDPSNPIAVEIARLVGGYADNLRRHAQRLGRIPKAVLRVKPRWPIEAVAMELTTAVIKQAISDSPASSPRPPRAT